MPARSILNATQSSALTPACWHQFAYSAGKIDFADPNSAWCFKARTPSGDISSRKALATNSCCSAGVWDRTAAGITTMSNKSEPFGFIRAEASLKRVCEAVRRGWPCCQYKIPDVTTNTAAITVTTRYFFFFKPNGILSQILTCNKDFTFVGNCFLAPRY